MLTFNLKKEWYEKIRSGKKTIEYREAKPYWSNRLVTFYKNNTSADDDLHKYIDKWEKYFKPTGQYFSPAEMFEKDAKRKGFNFENAYCKLRFGYTNQYLTARITKIEIVDGKDTDLHIDKPVYAIHLANVKECQ